MKKKTNNKKKLKRTISVSLDHELINELDTQVKALKDKNPEITRTSLIRSLLLDILTKNIPITKLSIEQKDRLYKELIEEILTLRNEIPYFSSPNPYYLLIASKELKAMSLLDQDNEKLIINHLINVILLIKKGTGYQHLPEISSKLTMSFDV